MFPIIYCSEAPAAQALSDSDPTLLKAETAPYQNAHLYAKIRGAIFFSMNQCYLWHSFLPGRNAGVLPQPSC